VAEVATVEEHERAAAESAATVARAARLAMAELAAARVEVEVKAAVAAAELKALRASSIDSSISANDDKDNELKLVREAAWEQVAQWAAAHPPGRRGGNPDGRGHVGGAPGGGARGGHVSDGGGIPDRHRRIDGWVDRDRGLYR
jgi:hypothetical protein